jgi:deoxyribonucleoside regulator
MADYHELLAQVASMYYEQDKTQNVIADELGISRAKVYRLLKQAREEQVVRIIIDWPTKRDTRLEVRLCEAFGLKDALVLQNQERIGTLQALGQLGARYLEGLLAEIDTPTLAMCLGRATYEVINAIRPDFQTKARIAQAMGSVSIPELDSAALVRQLAHKIDAEVQYLLSPLVADSAEDAAVLRNQREIQRTLMTARVANVALLGIGNLDPATSKFVGVITTEELQQITAEGAVGDLAGQIFRIDGQLHPCTLNQRVIAITLDELRQIPSVIAVAAGLEKSRAILGALRTGVINVLVTDAATADSVLRG